MGNSAREKSGTYARFMADEKIVPVWAGAPSTALSPAHVTAPEIPDNDVSRGVPSTDEASSLVAAGATAGAVTGATARGEALGSIVVDWVEAFLPRLNKLRSVPQNRFKSNASAMNNGRDNTC